MITKIDWLWAIQWDLHFDILQNWKHYIDHLYFHYKAYLKKKTYLEHTEKLQIKNQICFCCFCLASLDFNSIL